MIGDSSRVEERATIKRSIIGRHCIIGKMAKLVGCVLLDHCVVEDGAKLDNCVLGMNTKIGAKAEMSKCVTQGGYEVDSKASIRNEKLEVSDWAAQPSDDEDISETGIDSESVIG
jgi:translation initiation factor eIF-2B subunit gamma